MKKSSFGDPDPSCDRIEGGFPGSYLYEHRFQRIN